jgi:hypothetical protein
MATEEPRCSALLPEELDTDQQLPTPTTASRQTSARHPTPFTSPAARGPLALRDHAGGGSMVKFTLGESVSSDAVEGHDDDDGGSTAAARSSHAHATSLIASCAAVPSFTGVGLGPLHLVEDALSYTRACRRGHELIETYGMLAKLLRLSRTHRELVFSRCQTAKDAYVDQQERHRLSRKQRSQQRAQGSAAWRRRKQSYATDESESHASSGQDPPSAPTRRASTSPVKKLPRSPSPHKKSPHPLNVSALLRRETSSVSASQLGGSPGQPLSRGGPLSMRPVTAGRGDVEDPESYADLFQLLHGRPVVALESQLRVSPTRRARTAMDINSLLGSNREMPLLARTPAPAMLSLASPHVTMSRAGVGFTDVETRQKVAVRYEMVRGRPHPLAVLASTLAQPKNLRPQSQTRRTPSTAKRR